MEGICQMQCCLVQRQIVDCGPEVQNVARPRTHSGWKHRNTFLLRLMENRQDFSHCNANVKSLLDEVLRRGSGEREA